MGFDLRLASAMNVLGYDVFPFEAFDSRGRLRIPTSVDYPAGIQAGLGRIADAPVWSELYKRMSALDDPGHRAYMAGIGFHSNRVQIVIFRDAATVGGPDEAVNWARAYHGTLERTLYQWAGRSYLVDPKWAEVVEQAKAALPPEQQDLQPEADTADLLAVAASHEAPLSAETISAAVGVPWLSLGLGLLSSFLSKVTVRTKVVTTVLWFPADGSADLNYAQRWSPIHLTDLQEGVLSGHRSVHGIWNYRGLPVVWYGSEVAWTGPGIDMPHRPDQWCQALRPTARCVAGFTSQDGGGIEAARPEPVTHNVGGPHAGRAE